MTKDQHQGAGMPEDPVEPQRERTSDDPAQAKERRTLQERFNRKMDELGSKDPRQAERTAYSKVDAQRRAREERLEAQKGRSGEKKPLKVGPKKSRKVIGWIVGIVVVLALVIWLLFGLGIPQRHLSALHVGDEGVPVVEYNYYYRSLKNYYMQSTGTGGNLDEKAPYSDRDETWGEYYKRLTESSLQETYILADQAKRANHTLSEDSLAMIDAYFEQLKLQVGGELEMENYLEMSYGKGATPEALKKVMERQQLAAEFANELPETYTFDDAEVEAHYKEDPAAYDLVDYRLKAFRVNTSVDEGEDPLTDEEKQARTDEVRKVVEEAKTAVEGGTSFVEAADEAQDALDALNAKYQTKKDTVDDKLKDDAEKDKEDKEETTDADDAAEEEKDETLHEDLQKRVIYPAAMGDWLFEEGREANEQEIIEEGQTFYLVQFLERKQDTRPVTSVRYLLFEASLYGQATEEQRNNAKHGAEQLRDKISSEQDMLQIDEGIADSSYPGETVDVPATADEEAKKAVVMPKPSVEVEEVAPGAGLEYDLTNWAIDPARKVGDTTVSEGTYGYYVAMITGIKDDNVQWTYQVRQSLAQEAFNDAMESWREDDAYAVSSNIPGRWMTP